MTRKNGGRNNAVKHGAFTHDVILPGEHADDLEQIYQELVEEWRPDGPTESATVCSLAECHVSKQRLDRFYRQQVLSLEEDSDDSDVCDLQKVRAGLDRATTFDVAYSQLFRLSSEIADQIKEEVPYESFATDEQAGIAKLKSGLDEWIGVYERAARRQFQAEQAAKLYELTTQKIGAVERVEAMIDKLMRRLFQLKAFKEITNAHPAQPRILDVSHSATKNG